MKQFADLIWVDHHVGGEQATLDFDNGYGVNVLRGGPWYTQGGTYEVAVMHGGNLCYDTHITNDVLGRLSEADVNDTLSAIQELKPSTGDR